MPKGITPLDVALQTDGEPGQSFELEKRFEEL
jgi:hypothetical protein